MSVDKFGRSSASIARRPLPLIPSKRLLQSVGALCRTGEYVDFKTASARNLGKPVQSKDAATKEYVDKCVKSVEKAAEKSVTDNLERVISETHKLSKDYFDSRQESVNIGFKVIIKDNVEKAVRENLVSIGRELAETKTLLQQHKDSVKIDADVTSKHLLNFNNELTLFKERMNKQDSDVKRVEEAYTIMADRVRVLEDLLSGAAAAAAAVPSLKPNKVTGRKPSTKSNRG